MKFSDCGPGKGSATIRSEMRCVSLSSTKIYQSTPLNRVTSVRGHFDPIKRKILLTENLLY